MNMLINPDTFQVIRPCPLNKGWISCDQLRFDTKFEKELGSYEGDNLANAFAHFCNENIISDTGWYESDHLTFNSLDIYFYGNSK